MTHYVAFLRGINVGGNRIIKMIDLRAALGEAGFTHVSTYIQSGNILLASDDDETTVARRVETLILAHYGFHSDTIVRSVAEIHQIAAHHPFAAAPPRAEISVYAMLLPAPLDAERAAIVADASTPENTVVVQGREVFWRRVRVPGVAPDLPRAANRAIGLVTVRDMKTMRKLAELVRGAIL